jgi:antirestriction protein ArdC
MNVNEIVTDRIINELRKGTIPWQKPWFGVRDGAYSYETKKPYSFLNQLLLGKEGAWLTLNAIKKSHGTIKAGEASNASIVTFWKIYTKEEKVKDKIAKVTVPILMYYRVWHETQIEGINFENTKVCDSAKPIQKAEKIITEYVQRESANGFKFTSKASNRAYYSPTNDEVIIPKLEQFELPEEYYSTAFHEIGHSTLKECRCNRKEGRGNSFGNGEYSKEELVAELTAASLVHYCGIESEKSFKNSTAYIQSWINVLQNDTKLIVSASSKAQKAVEYILNEKKPETNTEETAA